MLVRIAGLKNVLSVKTQPGLENLLSGQVTVEACLPKRQGSRQVILKLNYELRQLAQKKRVEYKLGYRLFKGFLWNHFNQWPLEKH